MAEGTFLASTAGMQIFVCVCVFSFFYMHGLCIRMLMDVFTSLYSAVGVAAEPCFELWW